MKNKDYLTVRQEELMNFLWKVNEPLTANEMAERLAEDGWNNVTLFKTVQSLTTDGYLEVVGLEKTVKTYARKLAPSMSKDDYYASVLIKRGIDSSSIANITAALIMTDTRQVIIIFIISRILIFDIINFTLQILLQTVVVIFSRINILVLRKV